MNNILIIIFIVFLCIIYNKIIEKNTDLQSQNFNTNLVEYKININKNKSINDSFYKELDNLHILNFNHPIYGINDIDYIIYASYNNTIIGFCLLKEISNEYESVFAIYSLNVFFKYRKFGIASKIIKTVKNFIKNLNSHKTIVLGITDKNLIKFYENNEFYIYFDNKSVIPHENTPSYTFMKCNI
jgi:GNAT superfamily N-acetyltransferase